VVELPAGTVTFLFTDIEGSTRLLKRLREQYEQALAVHDRILRGAIADAGGQIVDNQGDAFFAAFPRARGAIAAAVEAQRLLAETAWPEDDSLRVRMGIHTGEPMVDRVRYVGLGVSRASRICAAAHGGQVLVSGATREVCEDDLPGDVALRDLGEHRLKDLDRPEHLYQLVVEGLAGEFPAPRTGESDAAATELADAVVERGKRGRRRRALVVGALVIVAGVVAAVLALSGGKSSAAGVAANSVAFVDARHGHIGTQVSVDEQPGAVAFGEGAVWTASASGTLSRIDPVSRTIRQTIPVGNGPSGIAVGGGGVWLTNNFDGTVSWIRPQSNAEARRIPVGSHPTAVAYGLGAVWVANSADRTLSRIDPSTGEVVATIQTNAVGRGVTVGGGSVWVTDEATRSLVQVDPATNDVVSRTTVGAGPTGVVFGAGSVWVANSLDDTVSRIDPTTLAVRQTIPLSGSPAELAFGGGSLWVATEFGQRLVRIDPGSGIVRTTTPLGNRPAGIAAGDDGVWVAVQSGGAGHRGGRLVVIAHTVNTIDPQSAGIPSSRSVATTIYDGLAAYRRVGGSAGEQLVPDLAVALPQPTDRGMRYTFRLRRGIRYSDGRRLRAADFRRAAERTLIVNGPLAGFVGELVGGSRCKPKRRCDLSRGVIVTGPSTLVFRLTRPDPRFFDGLSYLYPIPPGTPDRDVGTKPVPSTGPYRIETDVPGKLVVLTRNQFFHVSSRSARPDGYPDEIVWRRFESSRQATKEVLRGRADLVFHAVGGKEVASLAARVPRQLHILPENATVGVFLNVLRPPFDDIRVRHALSYAVDRKLISDLHGGPLATPTCQLVPPSVPGYKRYCPYTFDPSADGIWKAPDLPRARGLIRRSGTRGQPVVVWTFGSFHAEGKYVVALLRRLGYKSKLHYVQDTGDYFTQVLKHPEIQAGFLGWFGSSPGLAADMLANFTCDSKRYFSHFCDPRLDREIKALLRKQEVDPTAGAPRAEQLDRELVKASPWVTLLTPNWADLTSARVGNYQVNPSDDSLIDQMWVR
jgi:YVTN family beta-propeller protein